MGEESAYPDFHSLALQLPGRSQHRGVLDGAYDRVFRRAGGGAHHSQHREIIDAILESVAPAGAFERETGFITSLRHELLLREALQYLAKTRGAVTESLPHEMLLLDLYGALRPLDAITGATTADDILNRIFATFCIGK